MGKLKLVVPFFALFFHSSQIYRMIKDKTYRPFVQSIVACPSFFIYTKRLAKIGRDRSDSFYDVGSFIAEFTLSHDKYWNCLNSHAKAM